MILDDHVLNNSAELAVISVVCSVAEQTQIN